MSKVKSIIISNKYDKETHNKILDLIKCKSYFNSVQDEDNTTYHFTTERHYVKRVQFKDKQAEFDIIYSKP